MKHLTNNLKLDSFLWYIVNNTDNNILIKEGLKTVNITVDLKKYIKHYDTINKDSLNSISPYMISSFESNGKTFGEHYKAMKRNIKEKCIYLQACEKNSMEKNIINLFYDQTSWLPIVQNILICNKETFSEEMQLFFIEQYYVIIIIYL